VPLWGHRAALIELATGHSRRLNRVIQRELSADGRQAVWIRDRRGRCDVAVRTLASGRPLAPSALVRIGAWPSCHRMIHRAQPMLSTGVLSRDGPQIALLS
jgi:hypothetical protein